METIKDKEPGEIPQTEKSKELEDSEVASVEEKPDESIKIGNAQELSSPEIDKTERGQAITEKEIELPENEFKHEEISETEPGEKQDESKLEFVEENLDVPTKLVELVEEKVGGKEESPAKEVDAAAENEVKVSEINETKPVETIEGQSVDPEIPEKPSVEAVEEKPENVDESHCKVVEDPVEEKLVEQSQVTEQHGKEPPAAEPSENEAKVYEAELKPDVESTPEAKLEEKSKVTELHDKELPCAEPLGKETKGLEDDLRPEEISKSTPEEKLIKQFEATEHEKETPENEAVALQTEIKPEETVESTPDAKPLEQSKVTELHDKELPSAEPSEKEWKVLEDTLKPEEISESTPEEKLIEQSEDTEQSEKEPKVFEAELKPDEISESTPHKVVKQSEVIEQSEKEPPNSEPVEQGKIEALAEKVNETELLNKDEPTILETRVEELPEKADTPNDHEESVKKIVDFNHPPEEKFIDSGRKEPETETQDEKSVATRELNPREDPKPTESEAIEKPTKEEVTSRDIEPLTENGSTKNEAEVEGNGHEEATKEAEKCEPATQIENIGRSLKEKLEQEKRDDKPTKTDVQTETTNGSEDTKAAEDESKEEVPVKTTQKQSNNIMKLVKQSLVKAKKAIIGKSTNSKAPVSEIKCDEASK
ncbi:titin-like [Dorcoceras hygrometricum]|nr:titin-like [Dorcoceras hygrometricum]